MQQRLGKWEAPGLVSKTMMSLTRLSAALEHEKKQTQGPSGRVEEKHSDLRKARGSRIHRTGKVDFTNL